MTRLHEAFSQVRDAVAESISEMYRTRCTGCDQVATTQYVSWVKQVPCGQCSTLADLHMNQVVMADMATKGAGLVVCPPCGHPWWVPAVKEPVECPACSHHFTPSERRVANTHYHCDACGHEDTILSVVREAENPPSHRMRCLTVWCESCGKRHQAPSSDDLAKYAAISSEVAARFDRMRVPREAVPAGFNTNQMIRYGYRFWHQMFNARQLAGLELLFGAVRQVDDQASRELLTLLASAALEFNSMFCGAKGLGTGAIRHVFAHHAFIPAKEPLEANLWGVHRSSGGYSTLYKERLIRGRAWADAPVERRFDAGGKAEKVLVNGERLGGRPAERFEQLADGSADMLLLNQSSEHLSQIPDGSIDFVITDPPYADSVMYSELSDYFYVWLRQALHEDHPSFRTPTVDDSREAVHNRGRGRDGAFYTAVLSNVFAEAGRKLKSDGRLAFTFHHGGENAWRFIEEALVAAGFVVDRWWPVFAEMESGVPMRGKENNGHLDIVFVCAKAGTITRPTPQDSVELMSERLSARVPLVAADHRALRQASAVQEHTWATAAAAELVEAA